jgi:hypothetical protein
MTTAPKHLTIFPRLEAPPGARRPGRHLPPYQRSGPSGAAGILPENWEGCAAVRQYIREGCRFLSCGTFPHPYDPRTASERFPLPMRRRPGSQSPPRKGPGRRPQRCLSDRCRDHAGWHDKFNNQFIVVSKFLLLFKLHKEGQPRYRRRHDMDDRRWMTHDDPHGMAHYGREHINHHRDQWHLPVCNRRDSAGQIARRPCSAAPAAMTAPCGAARARQVACLRRPLPNDSFPRPEPQNHDPIQAGDLERGARRAIIAQSGLTVAELLALL